MHRMLICNNRSRTGICSGNVVVTAAVTAAYYTHVVDDCEMVEVRVVFNEYDRAVMIPPSYFCYNIAIRFCLVVSNLRFMF